MYAGIATCGLSNAYFELWTNGANPSFDLSQTVTEIPEGVYELSANAMYRSSLTYGTATNCVLYATVGSNTYSAPIKNYGDCTASESLGGVANAMVNHKAYSTSIPYIVVKDGSATIGMKNTDALTYCTNGYWFIYNLGSFTFKNVTDSYYITLSARATEMIAKAADGDAKTALSTALSTYSTATVDNIEGLKAAINTYLWTAASDANPIDVTSYMANPTFDGGSLKFWMQDFGYTQAADMYQPNNWDLCYSSAKVNNTQFQTFKPQADGAKDGNCLYVRHRWSDVLAVENLRQTVKELPAGKYTLTVAVKGGSNVTDANTLTLTAGANTKTTTVGEFDKTNYKDYSVTVIKNDAETNLDICYGFNQKSGGEQLYYIDDFRLSYCGEVVSDEDAEALIASIPTDAMYTGAKTAMQSAKEALEANKSLTNYKALSAAIDAANTSIADYANLYTQIAIAKKYTVVNSANTTAYADAITAAETVYNNGSAESCAATIKNLTDYKVNDYNYVMTNYTEDANLGTWTNKYETNLKTEEGYDSSTGYYDLWSANAEPYISQTVTLPAGEYALIGIGRGQEGKSTENLSVKIGDGEPITVDFLMKGNTGLGVNTKGEADFTTGEGHTYTRDGLGQGWEYRFILFTLDKESSVTFGANATLSGSWAGVYELQVKTTESSVKELKIIEMKALADSAPTTSKMQTSVKTALSEKIEAAGEVTISDTKEQLQTVYNELKAAVDAANASVANYKALNDLISTSNACYNEAAEGSADFSNAISTAQTAYDNAETDATEAIAAIKGALDTYVAANVIDVVVNGTFDSNNDGWTSTTKASGQNLASNKEGDFTGQFWENWNNGPKTGNMYQTNATALPAGDYILKIAAFGDQVPAFEGSNLFVYANDQKKAVISDTPTYYYVPFTLTADVAAGSIEYGLIAEEGNLSQWLGIDNVTISYVSGMGNFLASEDDYEALAEAIAEAEECTLGFEADEYAPYNNVAAVQALVAAKAIDPKTNNSSSVVVEATTALASATWTVNTEEVNAVYDGSFNLTTKTDDTYILPIGWTNVGYNTRVYNETNMGSNTGIKATSQNATMMAKYTTEYGTEAGYTLPLKKGCYSLEFMYGGWGNTATRTIKMYNSSENATVTPSDVRAKDGNANTTIDSWSNYSGLIEIPADGDYILSFDNGTEGQDQICISDIVLKKAADVDVTINSYGCATFSSKYELEVPTDVSAYYATACDGESVTMEKIEDGKIPANTGVVLKAEAGAYTLSPTTGATAITGNLLVAVTTAINGLAATEGSNTNYVLKNGQFVTWTEGVKTNVAAGKAYLSVPSSSAALSIDFGDATAINTVNANTFNGARVNLAGQVVGNGYKGIVIENGKKVLVK